MAIHRVVRRWMRQPGCFGHSMRNRNELRGHARQTTPELETQKRFLRQRWSTLLAYPVQVPNKAIHQGFLALLGWWSEFLGESRRKGGRRRAELHLRSGARSYPARAAFVCFRCLR